MADDTGKHHWESVYRTANSDSSAGSALTCASLQLLELAGLSPTSRVIDIGAGASTLVDDLLGLGLTNIAAVDIAESSLAAARAPAWPSSSERTMARGRCYELNIREDGKERWKKVAAVDLPVGRAPMSSRETRQ